MAGKTTLVIGVTLLLAGVVGLSSSPMSLTGMMGGRPPVGINPVDLPDPHSEAAQLLQRYCTRCHGLPSPGLHTADDWPVVVTRMNKRMERMAGHGMMRMMGGGIDPPSDNESRMILAYLQKNALSSFQASQYNGIDAPAGQAFQRNCARCHALPDPGQHTVEEWPLVVMRMKLNMARMGYSVPDEATIDEIVGFLQRNAIVND